MYISHIRAINPWLKRMYMKFKDTPSPADRSTTGLTQDEFTQLQKAIVRLRSNVIKSPADEE